MHTVCSAPGDLNSETFSIDQYVMRLRWDPEKTERRQDWDKTMTRLRRDRDEIETRPRWDQDKTKIRPRRDADSVGMEILTVKHLVSINTWWDQDNNKMSSRQGKIDTQVDQDVG